MVDRYVKSDDIRKIFYNDANNLNGWAMSESLPYDEIKSDRIDKLEEILNTSDDAVNCYFIEVDLKMQILFKKKQKSFQLLLKTTKIILIMIIKKMNLILIHKLKN